MSKPAMNKTTHFRPFMGPGGPTACGLQAGEVLSVRVGSTIKVTCKRCKKSERFKRANYADWLKGKLRTQGTT